MSGISLRVLTAEDVKSLLSLEEVLRITENVYGQLGRGKAICPTKVSLLLPGNDENDMNWINSMPALLGNENIAGVKWVNVTSTNRRRNLPVTIGTIILNDASTGMPLAVVDGTWITHVRTGASVAIGAKYMARKNSSTATVIGAGSEGRSALWALMATFDLKKVNVVDLNPRSAEKFVEEASQKYPVDFRISDDVRTAAGESDMIILTTTARRPIMMFDWAKPGDFVCTVSCMTDLDVKFIQASDRFVVDDSHCALSRIRSMSGLEVDESNLFGDICQIIAQKRRVRDSDDAIITYAPAGIGAVDIAVAFAAYRKAAAGGVGATQPLIRDLKNIEM
jgi:ornithine cyclodeaminase/alanine dehydrogenase-like protein (mu-crystallin family)